MVDCGYRESKRRQELRAGERRRAVSPVIVDSTTRTPHAIEENLTSPDEPDLSFLSYVVRWMMCTHTYAVNSCLGEAGYVRVIYCRERK